MVAGYRLALANLGTAGLGSVVVSNVLATAGVKYGDQQALSFGRGLNTAGSLDFTIPIDATAALAGASLEDVLGAREVHLYRDEVLKWAGRLWAAEVQDKSWVRFTAEDWLSTFRRRELNADFFRQADEQFDIVWAAIAASQARTGGDLGITRDAGETPSGVTRTITYCAEERPNLANIIDDLADADDGFDYEITPAKVWKVYSPRKGTDLSGSVIFDTTDNVEVLAYSIDAATVTNELVGVGRIDECEPVHLVTAVDATSRTKYGLLEATLPRPDLDADKPLISAITRQRLAAMKSPLFQPKLGYALDLGGPDPVAGDFAIGDTVRAIVTRGLASFDRDFRVVAWTMRVSQAGHERVEIVLDGAA